MISQQCWNSNLINNFGWSEWISCLLPCLSCVADLDPGCPCYHPRTDHFGAGGRRHCGGFRGVLSDLSRQHTFHDPGKRAEVDAGKQKHSSKQLPGRRFPYKSNSLRWCWLAHFQTMYCIHLVTDPLLSKVFLEVFLGNLAFLWTWVIWFKQINSERQALASE